MEIDLNGLSENRVPSFNQSQAFMSFTRGHHMIDHLLRGPKLKGFSKPTTTLICVELLRNSKMLDP